jgi:hypothetical protein
MSACRAAVSSNWGGKIMDDSKKSEPDELSRFRARLRFASFAVPSAVTVLELISCWRRHFDKTGIEGAALVVFIAVWYAAFLSRRSRGLSARLGLVSVRAGSDEDLYGGVDVLALWGSVAFVGFTAYWLFDSW